MSFWRKHAKLFYRFVRLNWYKLMEYRINILLILFVDIVSALISLTFWNVIFSHMGLIKGWGYQDLILMIFFYSIAIRLFTIFLFGGFWLWNDIIHGNIDALLCRPVNAYLVSMMKHFNFHDLSALIFDTFLFIFFANLFHANIHLPNLILSGALIILSSTVLALMNSSLSCLAFWFGKVNFLQTLFKTFWRFERWPVTFFPAWFQIGLTAIFPLTYAGTVSGLFLLNKISLIHMLGAFGAITSIVIAWMGIFSLAWSAGLKEYESYGG